MQFYFSFIIFIFEKYSLECLWVKEHDVRNLLLNGSEKNNMYIKREKEKTLPNNAQQEEEN